MSVNTKKTFLLVAALILSLLLLAGCFGTATVSRGWAGVSAIDDTLIFATMTGRVYSVDSATGTVRGDPIKMVVPASGGLSCIPSCGGQQTTAIAIYSSPGVAGDLVYIGGYDGKVYAYQLVDGQLGDKLLWAYPSDSTPVSNIVGGLIVAGDNVYFASANGTVYALNVAKASNAVKASKVPKDKDIEVWKRQLSNKVWSAPAIDGDTLYIGCFDKNLYAISTIDGSIKWQFTTNGAINSTPLVSDGIVYIGSYGRCFYAVDAGTGELIWKFPAAEGEANSPQNWFWAKPLISGDILYAPCLDGKIYALNTSDGSLIDTFDVEEAISSSPVLVDNTLIVASTNLAKTTSRVYAIEISDGSRRELTSFTSCINAPLFASNGIVYIHTNGDSFYGLNVQNGALQKFSLTTSK